MFLLVGSVNKAAGNVSWEFYNQTFIVQNDSPESRVNSVQSKKKSQGGKGVSAEQIKIIFILTDLMRAWSSWLA